MSCPVSEKHSTCGSATAGGLSNAQWRPHPDSVTPPPTAATRHTTHVVMAALSVCSEAMAMQGQVNTRSGTRQGRVCEHMCGAAKPHCGAHTTQLLVAGSRGSGGCKSIETVTIEEKTQHSCFQVTHDTRHVDSTFLDLQSCLQRCSWRCWITHMGADSARHVQHAAFFHEPPGTGPHPDSSASRGPG